MDGNKERNHHFLYYIFQFDRNGCKIIKEKACSIQSSLLRVLHNGGRTNGERKNALPGPEGTDR